MQELRESFDIKTQKFHYFLVQVEPTVVRFWVPLDCRTAGLWQPPFDHELYSVVDVLHGIPLGTAVGHARPSTGAEQPCRLP